MEEKNQKTIPSGTNAAAAKTTASGNATGKTTAKKPNKAELRKKRIRNRNLTRNLIQLFFFLAMPSAFVAGFTGIKNIFLWIGSGSPLQMNSFVKSLIALAIFTILFGRYFCGYVCSFGTLGDLINYLSGLFQKKILKKKKQYQLPPKAVQVLQKLKYLNLLAIAVLCALGIYSKMSGTSCWDVFSRLTALKAVPSGYMIGILCFVLVLVGMAVQERFFCQFLCPMGAFFALLPVLPFSSLHREEANCIKGCNACANQCPVSLKLQANGDRGGECIACEKCVPTCPKGNITHPLSERLHQEFAVLIAKAALFFAMGCFMGWCRFF